MGNDTHPGVERIDSATSVVISLVATYSISGKTAYRIPVIFPVDTQRGTALRGNVVKLDKGTLFSVGDGTFRLDGAAISNTLALTRAPSLDSLRLDLQALHTGHGHAGCANSGICSRRG